MREVQDTGGSKPVKKPEGAARRNILPAGNPEKIRFAYKSTYLQRRGIAINRVPLRRLKRTNSF